MKTLILILLFCFSMAKAEDLSAVVDKLGDDDFEIRQQATEALSKYPLAHADYFLDLSKTFKDTDPEIAYRLELVAKTIFYRTEFEANTDIRKLRATLEIQFDPFYVNTKDQTILDLLQNNWPRCLVIKFVDWFGVSKDKLKCWDIITLIDGKLYEQMPNFGYGIFEIDKEVELTVIRFKDTEKIEKRGYIVLDEDEHEIVKVKVTPIVQKDIRLIDMERVNKILDSGWQQYYNTYLEKPKK